MSMDRSLSVSSCPICRADGAFECVIFEDGEHCFCHECGYTEEDDNE
jgi:Zn ribbon nucleic-acid-binding protein